MTFGALSALPIEHVLSLLTMWSIMECDVFGIDCSTFAVALEATLESNEVWRFDSDLIRALDSNDANAMTSAVRR
jgi:hypothetical protein